MSSAHLEYVAAGGNRHPSAADWDANTLAYGSGNNIAIWDPQSTQHRGVTSLLSGHTDAVNSVKLFKDPSTSRSILISGSADKSVRLWLGSVEKSGTYAEAKCLNDHTGSVNTIAVLPGSNIFITGAADATVIVWRFCISHTAGVSSITAL